jgi:hypothetical protein
VVSSPATLLLPMYKQDWPIWARGPYVRSRWNGSLLKSVSSIAEECASDKETRADNGASAQFHATPHAGDGDHTPPFRLAVEQRVAHLKRIYGN